MQNTRSILTEAMQTTFKLALNCVAQKYLSVIVLDEIPIQIHFMYKYMPEKKKKTAMRSVRKR